MEDEWIITVGEKDRPNTEDKRIITAGHTHRDMPTEM